MMSASPIARAATQSQSIPSSRHITINSASQLPNDYSVTPGGTFYSTTPGGTRIVYERNFLLQLKNSPMSQTPPKNIQFLPGFSPSKMQIHENNNGGVKRLSTSPEKARISPIAQEPKGGGAPDGGEQFEMDL